MPGNAWAMLTLAAIAPPAQAQTTGELIHQHLLKDLPPAIVRSYIGVTRHDTQIPCLTTTEDSNYNTPKTRLLLVGGLDASPSSAESVVAVMRWFYGSGEAFTWRKQFAVSAVPVANPDGWAWGTHGSNGSGGMPASGYPPKSEARSDGSTPEAVCLWRWIEKHAPDLVIEIRGSGPLYWQIPASPMLFAGLRPNQRLPATDELAPALNAAGAIPALRYNVGAGAQMRFFRDLLSHLRKARFTGPSPARAEMQKRGAAPP